MKFKVAINTQPLTEKIPSGDPRWGTFNDQFANREVYVSEFLDAIEAGHAYAGWHNGRRSLVNFELAQHISPDLDSGDEFASLDYLKSLHIVRGYASFVYSTPSSTPDAPRSRVVFLLDKPIVDSEAYRQAAQALAAQFVGADEATTDASRFFYGSAGCEYWFNPAAPVMPLAELRHIWRKWRKAAPAPKPSNIIKLPKHVPTTNGVTPANPAQAFAERIIAEELNTLQATMNGSRNHQTNRCAYVLGQFVGSGHLSEAEAERMTLAAALATGLPEGEALRTIASGLKAGKNNPKELTG